MDYSIKNVNTARRATAPTDPSSWERQILDQQASSGIPSYEDFVNSWHERFEGQRTPIEEDDGGDASTPTKQSHEPADGSDTSPGGIFDMGSLKDKIQNKGASLPRPPLSPFVRGPGFPTRNQKPSTGRSPASAGNFPSPKRGRDSADPEAFSFADQVRWDRARFQQREESDRRNRRKTHHSDAHARSSRKSQFPDAEQFHRTQPPPEQRKQPSATTIHHESMYRTWHDECDAQFRDKVTMTEIPAPPLGACASCSKDAVLSFLSGPTSTTTTTDPPPLTCIHSLETLFRSAIPISSGTGGGGGGGSAPEYIDVLKAERNRFHTDRFSACPAAVKPAIERAAQQLFVMIHDLLTAEKKRLEAEQAMKARARNAPHPSAAAAAAAAAGTQRWDDFAGQAW
ncbi:hypothetical protein MBLNU459_g1793t1 [Dothideomycetes sp. NU459]